VRFGVYTPNFGEYSDPRLLASLAREAEDAGWDGFFVYDHIVGDAYGHRAGDGIADPWIALSAIALATERIRIGPLVTALARRRPWKLARETVSLDHLSAGRLTLGVGLGGRAAFESFGEDASDRVRAAKLDEGLQILTDLWRGEALSHHGAHFRVTTQAFLPRPLQSPRIPVWVAGIWPNRRPFRRAARWDGAFPLNQHGSLPSPAELRLIRAYVGLQRDLSAGFDLIVAGSTRDPGRDGSQRAERSAEAGATWWLEWLEPERGPLRAMRARVRQGPPRIGRA
jgi:alkanesulfonate monooxygenase SsuD/methylene tetrahydromethanopterin reductase-like flavin-dependent oxidoreductase (luciferase family)